MKGTIKFKLNNKPVSLTVDGERMLLWVLRTDLGLTGAKYGCGEGYCGACTVLVNNRAVRSCQTAVKDVQGKETGQSQERSGGNNVQAASAALFVWHGVDSPGNLFVQDDPDIEHGAVHLLCNRLAVDVHQACQRGVYDKGLFSIEFDKFIVP